MMKSMTSAKSISSGLFLLLLVTVRVMAKIDHIPKTLVYITTHMSDPHKEMFKHCWPQALKNSQLLRNSDIMVYMTPKAEDVDESIRLIKETFKKQNLKYYVAENKGYQQSAWMAIKVGSEKGFFDRYEWVFRFNPDVMLQSDKWFLDTMKNDANASLLYVECWFKKCQPPKVCELHTDFFAFKPGALPKGQLETHPHLFAEKSFTIQMRPLIKANQHRHVPDAYPKRNRTCRIDGNLHGPVVHYHSSFIKVRRRLKKENLCPAKFF